MVTRVIGPMGLWRQCVLIGVLSSLAFGLGTVVPTTASASPAHRQGNPAESSTPSVLEVTSVSPWVQPDGTLVITFERAGLPDDAVVTTTIHQRLGAAPGELRAAAENRFSGPVRERNLQAPVSAPLDGLPRRGTESIISIPVRSDNGGPERQLIPNAGIHPVTVSVTDAQDEELRVATVFLNRLPEDPPTGRDGQPAVTTVSLLAGLDSGIALGPDGGYQLPTEERVAVQAWRTMLDANLALPLTVALRPDTLLGLQRSGDPLDVEFVSDLAESGFTFAPQTYVRVDTAGLAARDRLALERQLARGAALLNELTGATPDGPWMLDDRIDTDTAGFLASRGTDHFVVSEDRLSLLTDDRPPGGARTLLRNRTLALQGVRGATVSSYDVELTGMLLEAGLPPALRAHRVTTALMASWFDATRTGAHAFPGVSSAILLYPGTDARVLEVLVDSLDPEGPLALTQPGAPTAERDGTPIAARLDRSVPEVDESILARWLRIDERIGGFDSMTVPGDPVTGEWALLNDQTPALGADPATRTALWNHVDSAIDERLAQIQTPPPRTVVLTSRSESIPIRFRNRGDEPLTVRIRTRSPRLEFPEGAVTDVLLNPGENRIDVPVAVRAPGSSVMRVELSSPDGRIEIREVRVTVRSWSISGVGAVLSVVSLLVLAGWWLRTFLRDRSRPPTPTGPDTDTSSAEPIGTGDHDAT